MVERSAAQHERNLANATMNKQTLACSSKEHHKASRKISRFCAANYAYGVHFDWR